MVRVDGLASGLDTTSIINQLLAVERRPIDFLVKQRAEASQRQTLLLGLQTKALSLQADAKVASSASLFEATAASVSNESVLTASASSGAPIGSFAFTVAKTATGAQFLSEGIADFDTTAVGAGSFRIELGDSRLAPSTELDTLNGGNGVQAGSIRIVDDTTNDAFIVDLRGALTLSDVVKSINASPAGVTAAVDTDNRDQLELTGPSGGFTVQDTGGTTTATDLGLAKTTNNGTLTGDDINQISSGTPLDFLNDRLGIRSNSSTLAEIEFSINGGDQVFEVDLTGATTIGEVIDAIDAAKAGIADDLTVSIDNTDNGLRFTSGTGVISIRDINDSNAARDLGITVTNGAADGVTPGSAIARLDDVLVRNLNGGGDLGIGTGNITFTDRARDFTAISFTQDDQQATLADLLDRINTALAAGNTDITLSIDGEGNGLLATDSSGSTTQSFTIVDTAGNVGRELGLLTTITGTAEADATTTTLSSTAFSGFREDQLIGRNITATVGGDSETSKIVAFDDATDTVTVDGAFTAAPDEGGNISVDRRSTTTTLNGSDLDRRFLSERTNLNDLNGRRGVSLGSIRVTAPDGSDVTLDLNNAKTVGDVLTSFNVNPTLSTQLTASINSTGDGILIAATAAGATAIKIEEVSGGTTARDLNILATSPDTALADNRINGSVENRVAIAANDTLEDVQRKINELNLTVVASIVDDGSSLSPFRLSLVNNLPGLAAQVSIDPGGMELGFTRNSDPSDAVLITGNGNSRFRSRDNIFRNVISDITVTAKTVGSSSVTTTRDTSGIVAQTGRLVSSLNIFLDDIRELTKFDTLTNTNAPFFGDQTLRRISQQIRGIATSNVEGIGSPSTFNSLGISLDSAGRFQFNLNTFESLLADNPEQVRKILSIPRPIEVTTRLEDFRNGEGITFVSDEDIRITKRDGTTFNVNFSSSVFASDIINKINDAGGGDLIARIKSDGTALEIVDTTGGTGLLKVEALNNSSAGSELGIIGQFTSNVLTGIAQDLRGDRGIAANLAERLAFLTDPLEGDFSTKNDGIQNEATTLDERIEELEERLARKEERIQREFTQLELILSKNNSTLAQLNSTFVAFTNFRTGANKK